MKLGVVTVLVFLGISFGAWSQDAKFVSRPTEEVFKIPGIAAPLGVHVDNSGRIYVNSSFYGSMNIFRPDGTLESTFGHRVEQYNVDDPMGFVNMVGTGLDKDGNIYISEGTGNRIRVFNNMGEPLLTINMPEYLLAIFDEATGLRLYMPGATPEEKNLPGRKVYAKGLCYDIAIATNGNIYATDGGGDQIVVFDYEGNVLTSFEYLTINNQLKHFNHVGQLSFNSKGELFSTQAMVCMIVVVDAKGNYLRHFGQAGNTVGSFQRLSGIAIDDLDRVYCSDFVIGSVQVFDDQGNFLHVLTDKGGEQWKVGNIGSLAVDPKRVYLVEVMADAVEVRKFVK